MREIGSHSNLVCNASFECLPPKLACRCENTVNSTNTAFQVRGCEYAVTSSWAENVKAFTFIHYQFNYKPGDRCKTVADMLVDINFAAFAVKVLLTDSHRALAPMRQGDDTFVSFNLGAWETKNAKERFVECHGHAQWNVEVGYDNFEQDLQSLFRSFGVEWVTQSIVD